MCRGPTEGSKALGNFVRVWSLLPAAFSLVNLEGLVGTGNRAGGGGWVFERFKQWELWTLAVTLKKPSQERVDTVGRWNLPASVLCMGVGSLSD